MPYLKSLVERHTNEPFAILGINTDDDKDEYHAKLKDFGVTWESAWDGSTSGPISSRWAIMSFPSKFLIDVDGVIRYTPEQLRGDFAIDAAIEKLLEEAKSKKK